VQSRCCFFLHVLARLTRISSSDATQTLAGVADKIKNFAIIYLVDINEVRTVRGVDAREYVG